MPGPAVSFVVPAHDEEQLLGRCLRSIHASAVAAGVDHELIVADDASTDATPAIAAEHGARVVSVTHRQISATRNAGAAVATAPRLVFVDADTVVNAEAVAEAMAAMDAGAVGGGSVVHVDGEVPRTWRILLRLGRPFYRLVGLSSGCFLFCTREAYHAVGGFDEKLYAAEEGAMSWALRRHGRFVVMRSAVITSGRKIRTYRQREIFGLLARMFLLPWRTLRKREGMELLYGKRRPDPGA